MFKCEKCGRITEPKEPQTKLVDEVRPVSYLDEHRQVIGRGTEIVKEISVCQPCAAIDEVASDIMMEVSSVQGSHIEPVVDPIPQ